MATVVAAGKVKLSNGQIVNAQQGGWYDGQQYWGGTLSTAGQINSQSNQIGAGQMVSPEVNAQSAAQQGVSPQQFEQYLAQQRASSTPTASPSAQTPGVPTPASSPSTAPGAGAGVGFTAPTPIDLPGLYRTLSENAGISAIEQKLADAATAYAEAQSKINDNPFLSEATRVGRISKLSTDYQNAVKNDVDLLAMKKADIEVQLNLQSKQFDINSQVARDALDRFNSLLSSGALNTASGEDIANIARSTGMSTAAIQSAVEANRAKNVQTSVVSYDDGTNQGFAVINTQTGEIISKQTIAASKPKAASEGSTKEADYQANTQSAIGDIQRGVKLRDLVSHYGVMGGLPIEDLYRLYNTYSPYGTAYETLDDVKEGRFES